MKARALLLLIVLFSRAFAGETEEKEATLAITHQHMVLNMLSGLFYCKNQRWPEGVNAVRDFQEAGKVTLPVEPRWDLLGSEKFSYVAGEKLEIRSQKDADPSAHEITSMNSPPVCDGKNVELRAHISIK